MLRRPPEFRGRSKSRTGTEGERIAVRHLKERNYRIIERNFRCRFGEIDIVAAKEEYLVFVEVKTRNAGREEIDPMISVTQSKCRKLRQLGTYYIQSFNLYDMQPRFDVVGITIQDSRRFTLEHIENAF